MSDDRIFIPEILVRIAETLETIADRIPHLSPTDKRMRTVAIESPYAGTPKQIERNVKYARAAMADCLARGEAPFASHLLYTQVLYDRQPAERQIGIDAGFEIGALLDARVVYTDLGQTPGMLAGIDAARTIGQPVEYRSLPSWKAE